MKNKSGKSRKLKNNTVKQLELLGAKLQTIKSVEELANSLNEISDFSEQTIEEYIPSGNIELVNSLQKEIAELYDVAIKIVEKPSFSEFSALKNFIESMKESWLRSVESSKEEIAENCRSKGYVSRKREDYRESLAYLNKALEIKPKDPRNWFERGSLLFDMGDFVSAIRDYEMVLEFDQGNPYALCNIGLSLQYLHRFEESLKYFDEALRIDPNFVKALVGMGNSYIGRGDFELGDFDNAQEKLKEALKLDPDYVDANLAMGSLMHEGFYDIKKSKKYAEKVLELDGDNIVAKANLAETLLAFGEYEQSSKFAEEVLGKGPAYLGYPMRLVNVCSLYFRKRDEEAAQVALDLIEYYEVVHDKIVTSWKFHGLRKTIANNKQITMDVKSILISFIDLVENPNEYAKNRLLMEIPERIRSKKGPEPRPRKEIFIKNTSKRDRYRKGYYDWAIFLTPKDALNEVERVVYTLHETFQNPVREIVDRETGFKLKSKGWGEFQVKAEIYFYGLKDPLIKYHWLKLLS